MNRRKTLRLVGAALLFGAAAFGTEAPLTTVPFVDLNKYAGHWFEIARYPNRFERKCDRDVTADYALVGKDKISVANTCVTAKGEPSKTTGTAKIADTATNAKLKVTFFWPFSGNYWVTDLAGDYRYAVVGEPSRKYLWILGRTAAMDDATYKEILARVAAKGYDASRLVRTKQSALSGTVGAPSSR